MVKRISAVLLICFAGFMLLLPINKIYADNPLQQHQINQQLEEKNSDEKKAGKVKLKEVYEGRILKEKEKFPLDHYELETYFPKDMASFLTLGYSQSGQQMIKGTADTVWFGNKILAEFFIYSVGEMMSYDFLSKVSEPLGKTLEKISGVNSGNGVFTSFLTIIVAIMAGALVIIYYGKNNASGAIQALISSVVILVGCYWFYGDATKHLKSINKISSEIESTISGWTVNFSSEAEKTDGKAYTAKESAALLENQLFNLMVKKPYLHMMYGTSKEDVILKDDKERINKLLEIKTWDSDSKKARSKIVQDEVEKKNNTSMNILMLAQRLGYTLLYLIATLFLGIPFMLLAATKLVLQILFIVMILISPVLFLIALIPNFQETASVTIKKLIGLILAKAGIVFLVTISLGLTTLLYEGMKASDGFGGHAFLIFMDCLCLFSIFKYRSEIFAIASSAKYYATGAAERVTQVAQNGYGQVKDYAKQGAGFVVDRVRRSGARNQQNKNPMDNVTGINAENKHSKPTVSTTSTVKPKESDKRAGMQQQTPNQDVDSSNNSKKGISGAFYAMTKKFSKKKNTPKKPNGDTQPKEQTYIPIPPHQQEKKKSNGYIPIPSHQQEKKKPNGYISIPPHQPQQPRVSQARQKSQVKGVELSKKRQQPQNNKKANDAK